MTLFQNVKVGLQEISQSVREPEALALRWQKREADSSGPPPEIFMVLLGSAVFGLGAYGLTLGLHLGPLAMLSKGALLPLAAGLSWMMALPALYIIGGALGSRLDASTTLLAACIACSFGAMAMLASVPIHWFFTLALPFEWARLAINVVIFTGVGACIADVFLRVMEALEPGGSLGFRLVWVALLGALGLELFLLFDVFSF